MQADSPRTVPELIDALGGPTAVSRVIGKRASTVSEMKRSGSIDVKYWPALIAEAGTRGVIVTSDALMLMHAKPAEATT